MFLKRMKKNQLYLNIFLFNVTMNIILYLIIINRVTDLGINNIVYVIIICYVCAWNQKIIIRATYNNSNSNTLQP